MARQFALPYACCILAFMAVFLLNDVLNGLVDCLDAHLSFGRIAIYFLAKLPPNLVNIVPISVLLAGSFMTVMLGRNNELTAMRAAGLSIIQCALPVWVIVVLSALMVFFINESLALKCAKISNNIELTEKFQREYFKRLTFYHPSQHRDWAIENVEDDGSFSRVIVRQYREDGTNDYLVAAVKATFKDGKWTFFDGCVQFYDEGGQQLAKATEFFDEKAMPFAESPQEINTHSNRPENMNISELSAVLRENIVTSKRGRGKLKSLIWYKLTVPLMTICAALFGIALTVSTNRKSAVKGFAISVAVLVVCLLLGQFTLILAQNGYLAPFIGGALPNIAFLGAGMCVMWAKR